MSSSFHIEFTPTLQDYRLFDRELLTTPRGKRSRWITYFTFSSAILLLFYIIYSKSSICFGAASVAILLFNYYYLFKSDQYKKIYNHPDLLSTRSIEVNNIFIHERTEYYESWIAWNCVDQVVETNHYYLIFTKDNRRFSYIPVVYLNDKDRILINKAMNSVLQATQANTRSPSLIEDEILANANLPVIKVQGVYRFRDIILAAYDRGRYLSPLNHFLRIFAFVLFITFFIIFILNIGGGSHSERSLSIIGILLSFVSYFLFPLSQIVIHVIRYIFDRNKTSTDRRLVDGHGIYFEYGTSRHRVFWSSISKIIKSKHNYIFKFRFTNASSAILRRLLSPEDSKDLDNLLNKVISENQSIEFKIVK
jgi:hypothetical protein